MGSWAEDRGIGQCPGVSTGFLEYLSALDVQLFDARGCAVHRASLACGVRAPSLIFRFRRVAAGAVTGPGRAGASGVTGRWNRGAACSLL